MQQAHVLPTRFPPPTKTNQVLRRFVALDNVQPPTPIFVSSSHLEKGHYQPMKQWGLKVYSVHAPPPSAICQLFQEHMKQDE